MAAPIADGAVAEGHPTTPSAGQVGRMVGPKLSRPQPQVPVERGRNGVFLFELAQPVQARIDGGAAGMDGVDLANRARFNEFFEEQFARAYKLQRPLAILFIDIDHFKQVNDTYGHQAGDEVLKRLGKLLKLAVRNIDLAVRYGGEEFALVLTETDSNAAAQMADEIRQAIMAEQIVFEGKQIKISGSIGVAGTDRTRIFQSPLQLTNAADRAVYAAKAAGRNCVRLFRPKVQDPAAATAAKQAV